MARSKCANDTLLGKVDDLDSTQISPMSMFVNKNVLSNRARNISMHRSLTSEQDASWSEVGLYLTLWIGAVWLYLRRPWPLLFQITTTLSDPPNIRTKALLWRHDVATNCSKCLLTWGKSWSITAKVDTIHCILVSWSRCQRLIVMGWFIQHCSGLKVQLANLVMIQSGLQCCHRTVILCSQLRWWHEIHLRDGSSKNMIVEQERFPKSNLR